MKIKKYIVKALSEVDALILRDLGPQAVILTVRKIKPQGFSSLFFADQLEVVAAVEEEQTDKVQGPKKAREWESSMQTVEEVNSSLEEKPLPGLKEPVQYEPSKIPGTYLDPRFNRKQAVETANETILPSAKETSASIQEEFIPPSSEEEARLLSKNYENELDNLKRASKLLVSRFAFVSKETFQPISEIAENLNLENASSAYQSYLPWLLSKGLEQPFAETVAKNCQAQYGSEMLLKGTDDERFLELMTNEIAARIPVSGPLLLAKGAPTCMALAGPSGIGKTTALLKIAHQYALEANKNTVLIAIDPQGIETADKQTPITVVRSKQEWEEAFLQFKDHDLVLVDLPRFTKNSQSLIKEWADILKDVDKLQVHLALPAGIKIRDAQAWATLLQSYSPKALIITKTDETFTLGTIPMLCETTGLPLSYLTSGPQITSDLQIADPNAIAKAIVSSECGVSM